MTQSHMAHVIERISNARLKEKLAIATTTMEVFARRGRLELSQLHGEDVSIYTELLARRQAALSVIKDERREEDKAAARSR